MCEYYFSPGTHSQLTSHLNCSVFRKNCTTVEAMAKPGPRIVEDNSFFNSKHVPTSTGLGFPSFECETKSWWDPVSRTLLSFSLLFYSFFPHLFNSSLLHLCNEILREAFVGGKVFLFAFSSRFWLQSRTHIITWARLQFQGSLAS